MIYVRIKHSDRIEFDKPIVKSITPNICRFVQLTRKKP